jgi:hypothetical protein
MKINTILILGILICLSGCGDTKGHLSNREDNKLEYINPNNNNKLVIHLDNAGNPTILETLSEKGALKSISHYDIQGNINSIDFYPANRNVIKSYFFFDDQLIESVEYSPGNDSTSYTVNQSRYFDKNERVIENDGLFLDVFLDDTINYSKEHYAVLEPKGAKYDNTHYLYFINGTKIYTKSSKVSIPLDTKTKGRHLLSGYVSRVDSGIYEGEKVGVEVKVRLNQEYFVK